MTVPVAPEDQTPDSPDSSDSAVFARGSALARVGRAAAAVALAGARGVDRFGPAALAGAVLEVAWDGGWPPPLWLRPVRALAHFSTKDKVRAAIRVTQLAVRGWAAQDTWNLELVLCERLGAQLAQLADTGHTYPGRGAYADPDVWTADLRVNAGRLAAFASTLREDDEAGRAVDALLEQDRVDDDALRAALAAQNRVFEERLVGAQEALRWVADHLTHLND